MPAAWGAPTVTPSRPETSYQCMFARAAADYENSHWLQQFCEVDCFRGPTGASEYFVDVPAIEALELPVP